MATKSNKTGRKNKLGAGRPRIQINEEKLFELASYGCTKTELASFFDINIDTLIDNYSEKIHKAYDTGKIRLRKTQLNLADTSAAMSIFLGKNWLGQSDRIETVNTSATTTTITADKEALELVRKNLQLNEEIK